MLPQPHQLARRLAQFASLVDRLESLWRARPAKPECYFVLEEFPIGPTRPRVVPPEGVTLVGRRWGGDHFVRWAQVGFHGNWFYLELMDTVLSPGEAERLIRERAGFFFLRDRLDGHSAFDADAAAKLVRDFNPVHKCYRAGDRAELASDLAFLWFNVWRVPLDWVFHLKTNYFGSGTAEFFSLP